MKNKFMVIAWKRLDSCDFDQVCVSRPRIVLGCTLVVGWMVGLGCLVAVLWDVTISVLHYCGRHLRYNVAFHVLESCSAADCVAVFPPSRVACFFAMGCD